MTTHRKRLTFQERLERWSKEHRRETMDVVLATAILERHKKTNHDALRIEHVCNS